MLFAKLRQKRAARRAEKLERDIASGDLDSAKQLALQRNGFKGDAVVFDPTKRSGRP